MKRIHTFAALLLAAGAAQAVTNATVQLGVNPNFSGGTGPFNDVLTQAVWAEMSSGLVTGGFSSSGSAHAYAQIGTLKVDGNSAGSLNSVARAIFRDDFKVDVPGMAAGTQVVLKFTLLLSGNLSVTNPNDAAASWQVRADMGGGAFDLAGDATLYNDSPVLGVHGYVGTPIGPLMGTATINTGQMLPAYVELTGSAQTAYDGTGGLNNLATSAFDLSHTLRWGGMTVEINGVTQANAIVTSASGFDYLNAAPVPEPGTFALGLLGAAIVMRKRRPRH